MNPTKPSLIVALLVLTGTALGQHIPTPSAPPGSHPIADDACPLLGGAFDLCRTQLTPISMVPPPSGGESFGIDMARQFPNWNWTPMEHDILGGEINIATYDAHTCDPAGPLTFGQPLNHTPGQHCWHGADLEMTYTPRPEDLALIRNMYGPNATFNWIQVVINSGEFCESFPAADEIDCTRGPYYRDPNELASMAAVGLGSSWFLDAPQDGCKALGTSCGALCPQNGHDHWSFEFYTYLCAGTPGGIANGSMTVFEGVHWGFEANCWIPSPGSASLLALAGLAAIRRKR